MRWKELSNEGIDELAVNAAASIATTDAMARRELTLAKAKKAKLKRKKDEKITRTSDLERDTGITLAYWDNTENEERDRK
jgi:hypothetical protein